MSLYVYTRLHVNEFVLSFSEVETYNQDTYT